MALYDFYKLWQLLVSIIIQFLLSFQRFFWLRTLKFTFFDKIDYNKNKKVKKVRKVKQHQIDSILHILIELNGVHDFAIIQLMLDHSKIRKMPFWMIQIAKNEVFGHFLELGASDWLQIAYYDYTKWSWQVGYHIAHAGSYKIHKKCLFEWSKGPKMRFLAIFLS